MYSYLKSRCCWPVWFPQSTIQQVIGLAYDLIFSHPCESYHVFPMKAASGDTQKYCFHFSDRTTVSLLAEHLPWTQCLCILTASQKMTGTRDCLTMNFYRRDLSGHFGLEDETITEKQGSKEQSPKIHQNKSILIPRYSDVLMRRHERTFLPGVINETKSLMCVVSHGVGHAIDPGNCHCILFLIKV